MNLSIVVLTRSSQTRNGHGFFHLPAEAILDETLSEAEADIIICLGVAIVLGRGALMNEVRTHCSCPSRTSYPTEKAKRPGDIKNAHAIRKCFTERPKERKRERERKTAALAIPLMDQQRQDKTLGGVMSELKWSPAWTVQPSSSSQPSTLTTPPSRSPPLFVSLSLSSTLTLCLSLWAGASAIYNLFGLSAAVQSNYRAQGAFAHPHHLRRLCFFSSPLLVFNVHVHVQHLRTRGQFGLTWGELSSPSSSSYRVHLLGQLCLVPVIYCAPFSSLSLFLAHSLSLAHSL